jgi:hypothetical protein
MWSMDKIEVNFSACMSVIFAKLNLLAYIS